MLTFIVILAVVVAGYLAYKYLKSGLEQDIAAAEQDAQAVEQKAKAAVTDIKSKL